VCMLFGVVGILLAFHFGLGQVLFVYVGIQEGPWDRSRRAI